MLLPKFRVFEGGIFHDSRKVRHWFTFVCGNVCALGEILAKKCEGISSAPIPRLTPHGVGGICGKCFVTGCERIVYLLRGQYLQAFTE